MCVRAKRIFDWMLFYGFLSLVDMGMSEINEINRLLCNFC